jgi:hypothetical protein
VKRIAVSALVARLSWPVGLICLKALSNESIYPNIVELTVTGGGGLELEFARRIMEFHKSRYIEPRHGAELKEIKPSSRALFRSTEPAFLDQSGGSLVLEKKIAASRGRYL